MSEPRNATGHRVPDFLIMVMVVTASLVIGGVVLFVVPRPDPTPAAAPSPARTTSTPTASPEPTTAGVACFPDADLAARFVPLPAGTSAVEIVQLRGTSDMAKVAELWSLPPSYPEGRDAMIDQLRRHRFQACVHRYWEGGACGCGQSSLVTRFATERDAEAIAAWLERELTGREFVAVGTFDFAAVSRWVETDYAGPRSLTGLFARGPYVGFVQLGPDDDGDRAVFEALARQQYDLLSPG